MFCELTIKIFIYFNVILILTHNAYSFTFVTYVKLKAVNLVTGKSLDTCANAQPDMDETSPNLTTLEKYILTIIDDKSIICSEDPPNLNGKILFLHHGYEEWFRKCKVESIVGGILEVQNKSRASAILYLQNETFSSYRNDDFSNNSEIEIPIYFINLKNYKKLQELFDYDTNRSSEVELKFLEFDTTVSPNPGMAITLVMSMVCVVLGGLWSGYEHRQLFIKRELKYYKKVQKLTSGKVPTSAKQQETKSINKTAPKKLTSPERPSEKSGSPPDQNVASSTDQQYVPSPDQKSAPSTGQKSAPREKSVSLDVSSSTVEVPSQPFTWWTIVWFVVPIVVVLLLLYFLYHFFVWVIIVIFTIVSAVSMHMCLSLIMEKCSPCGTCGINMGRCVSLVEQKTKKDCSIFSCTIEYRQILLFSFCAGFAIATCITRKDPYNFIPHNILAMCFCIFNVYQFRMSNLKWITVLLTILLIYDVFMVFISPFFTKGGCSIMVDVATGGGCTTNQKRWGRPSKDQENLPILFRVPKFDPSYVCYDLDVEYYPQAMLGLADVIIPGFLVGFAYAFDLGWKVPCSTYFVTSVVGYFLGIVLTFAVLIFTKSAQPALVYLVPCTLIPTHCMALIRKQWTFMWKGQYPTVTDATLQSYLAAEDKKK